MKELSELGQEIKYGKTILHQIAIDLGLLKDDNFLFQYDYSDYRTSYTVISPTQNVIISVPKNVEDLKDVPYKVVKKLEEYGFDIGDLSKPPTEEVVNKLRDLCYNESHKAGWHTDPGTGELIDRNKAEMLCLVHSEISEAMEGERKGLMDDHLPHRSMAEVELADAVIRIMDYAGRWKYDIGGALIEKIEYNRHRADHKLENRVKEGGKKF